MTMTVLVTGAAGNLGRAVAAAFAARGANLALLGRDAAGLAAAFGADGPGRMSVAADLLDQGETDRAAAAVMARFGRIDVLCNLAGGFRMGAPVHELGEGVLDAMFDQNVRTLVHAVHAVVPCMLAQGGGRIVNIAAFAANRGAARMGAYSASKGAVVRLTEAMAAELREKNINVNCLLPTIIDTPQNRRDMPDADPSRWVAPADLARVILFLASDDAWAIHGAAIPVTGLS